MSNQESMTKEQAAAVVAKQKLQERIRNDFTYHKPPTEVGPHFVQIREKAKELALLIIDLVPGGREQSSSLTRLEEVVMHANAGIARQYPVEPISSVKQAG